MRGDGGGGQRRAEGGQSDGPTDGAAQQQPGQRPAVVDRGEAAAGSTAKKGRREVVIVSVNVGTIAYGVPETGGAAHGTSGTFSRAPTSENMGRLLTQMRRNNQDGTKRVALWVLSSTCPGSRAAQQRRRAERQAFSGATWRFGGCL